jgi:hypothetical protein
VKCPNYRLHIKMSVLQPVAINSLRFNTSSYLNTFRRPPNPQQVFKPETRNNRLNCNFYRSLGHYFAKFTVQGPLSSWEFRCNTSLYQGLPTPYDMQSDVSPPPHIKSFWRLSVPCRSNIQQVTGPTLALPWSGCTWSSGCHRRIHCSVSKKQILRPPFSSNKLYWDNEISYFLTALWMFVPDFTNVLLFTTVRPHSESLMHFCPRDITAVHKPFPSLSNRTERDEHRTQVFYKILIPLNVTFRPLCRKRQEEERLQKHGFRLAVEFHVSRIYRASRHFGH